MCCSALSQWGKQARCNISIVIRERGNEPKPSGFLFSPTPTSMQIEVFSCRQMALAEPQDTNVKLNVEFQLVRVTVGHGKFYLVTEAREILM